MTREARFQIVRREGSCLRPVFDGTWNTQAGAQQICAALNAAYRAGRFDRQAALPRPQRDPRAAAFDGPWPLRSHRTLAEVDRAASDVPEVDRHDL